MKFEMIKLYLAEFFLEKMQLLLKSLSLYRQFNYEEIRYLTDNHLIMKDTYAFTFTCTETYTHTHTHTHTHIYIYIYSHIHTQIDR